MRRTNEKIELKIIDLYTIEKLSSKKICKILGISDTTVLNILKRNNIDRRSLKIYSVNSNYFKEICSREKAQILGFIAADGCLRHKKSGGWRMSIKLSIKDINYLEYIKEKLNYTGPITYSKDYIDGKEYKAATLTIDDQKIYSDLLNKGITERKSLTLNFPTFNQVPEEYLSSYILGYFEGDGCICNIKQQDSCLLNGTVSICVSKNFGDTLQKYLKERLDINAGLYIKHKENPNGIWNLQFGGNTQVIKFSKLIYQDAPYLMRRKYDRFVELKKNLEYKISSQYINDRYLKFKNQRKIFWIQKDDQIYKVNGLSPFGREFNINIQNISAVINQRRDHAYGWYYYDIDSLGIPENYIELNY